MKLKKILPLLLSICMVGSTFVGCTDSSSDNGNDADSNVTDTDGSGSSSGGSSTDSGSSGSGNESSDSSSGSGTGTDTSTDTGKDTGTDTSTETGTGTGTETDTDTGAGTDTSEEVDTTNGGTDKTTVYMVGDSTMCSFEDSYYLPRYGYGTQLENYLNENVTVVNLAMSGRSSLSFLSETNYSTLTSSIGEGDYLIIGFGHNDEKSDEAARFTDPNPDYQTQYSSSGTLSFQYNLYENYIKLAEDAGATAILCTPIVRYNSSANYTGSSGHVTSDGDYPAAIRKLGSDTGTTVIDLTAITAADYVEKGADAMNYHAFSGTKDGERVGGDTTHLNKYGAKMVAYELVTALQSTSCQLKHYVKSGISAPTYETDYADAINTSYTEPDYEAFDASKYANYLVTGNLYHTAFGDIGGETKYQNYSFSYANGVYTISNGDGNGNGKFAASSDGLGAIFMQIGKSDNFTVSVTATVTGIGSKASNQSGFGLMLRDDIYIDTYDAGILSNYVAAGVLGSGTGNAIFSRENGTLTKGSDTVSVAANSAFELKIQRIGQTVIVTVGSYTKTYTDFDFFSVDNDYMYLCMFANRDLTVEFGNFTYTYDGVAQDA